MILFIRALFCIIVEICDCRFQLIGLHAGLFRQFFQRGRFNNLGTELFRNGFRFRNQIGLRLIVNRPHFIRVRRVMPCTVHVDMTMPDRNGFVDEPVAVHAEQHQCAGIQRTLA